MAAVPLIIDRIYKNVLSIVEQSGPFSSKFFQFCVEYRLRWNQIGMDCPLINRIVFRRVQQMVGGNLKFIGVGSAPLAPVAQRFVRTVLDVKICQGYGLTETLCTATIVFFHHFQWQKIYFLLAILGDGSGRGVYRTPTQCPIHLMCARAQCPQCPQREQSVQYI